MKFKNCLIYVVCLVVMLVSVSIMFNSSNVKVVSNRNLSSRCDRLTSVVDIDRGLLQGVALEFGFKTLYEDGSGFLVDGGKVSSCK